ncbi:hypothetical protein D3C72_2125460 [compost metagenome]
MHQPQPKSLFQLPDMPAGGVGWNAKTPRRLGETAGANHIDEQGDVVQVGHDIYHRQILGPTHLRNAACRQSVWRAISHTDYSAD